MSMEQAILEHAGALRELAAAIKSMGSGWSPVTYGTGVKIKGTLTDADGNVVQQGETLADTVEIAKEKITKQRAERDADQQAAGVCPEASEEVLNVATGEMIPADQAIKDGMEAARAKRVEKDAELEAAVSKVEEESKALDYKTDVRPVLLALAKKAGQPALKDLLTKYGAATGDKLTADQFAGIVADANALIAG